MTGEGPGHHGLGGSPDSVAANGGPDRVPASSASRNAVPHCTATAPAAQQRATRRRPTDAARHHDRRSVTDPDGGEQVPSEPTRAVVAGRIGGRRSARRPMPALRDEARPGRRRPRARASSADVTVMRTGHPAARSARTALGGRHAEGEAHQRDRVGDGQLDLGREVVVVVPPQRRQLHLVPVGLGPQPVPVAFQRGEVRRCRQRYEGSARRC